MDVSVEFHFDFGSPNAYLAHLVIPAIEKRSGVRFAYVPVLLGGVFKATGNVSPAVSLRGIKNKGEYTALETRRFLRAHGITRYAPNPFFPVNTLQIMRGAVAAQRLGCFERYVDEVYRHMWADPKKMDEPAVIRAALLESGLPADELLALAADPEREAGADREHRALRRARRVRLAELLRRRRAVLREGPPARGRGRDRGAEAAMKLGTSLRFLYPTGAHTHALFKQMLAAMPPGGFIERPLGATDTGEQARNVLEIAAAARAAGLDGLLYGDNHAVPAAFANSFAPIPTLARLMAVTGEMPLGVVLLAPFYHPIVLAEQIGTLAAFATAPLIVTLANGGRAQAFEAFGIPMASRAARLEELVAIVRALLAGERVTFHGKHFHLDGVSVSPLPRVPVSIWIAGTVPAAAERAGRIGDGWLTGQNATRERARAAARGLPRGGRARRPSRAAGAAPRHLRRGERHRGRGHRRPRARRGLPRHRHGAAAGGRGEERRRAAAQLPRARIRVRDGAPHRRRARRDAALVRAHRAIRDACDPRPVDGAAPRRSEGEGR